MFVVSGLVGSVYSQSYMLVSYAFAKAGYQVITSDTDRFFGTVLVETNPLQLLRNLMRKEFVADFYVGIEEPRRPPYSNLYVLRDNFVIRNEPELKLMGKHKCYLSKDSDYPYVKDGDVFLYAEDEFMYYEIKAFVERFGHKVYLYSDSDITEQLSETCEEVVPTNDYSRVILKSLGVYDLSGNEYDVDKLTRLMINWMKNFLA